MQIHELREQLHQKIDQLEDEKILAVINTLISVDYAPYVIPEEWKEGIQQGKKILQPENFTPCRILRKSTRNGSENNHI